MLTAPRTERAVMALACLLLVAGAVGAAVWSGSSRSPGPSSAPGVSSSVTATSLPSSPPTATAVPPTTGSGPATSGRLPGSTGTSAGEVHPDFLAATGLEADVALIGVLCLLGGFGLVWMEERTRLPEPGARSQR